MSALSRIDGSVLGRWWWTVDRWTLAAFLSLAMIGVVLTVAASPPVAERIGLDALHFVKRQTLLLGPALTLMLTVSLMDLRQVRRFGVALFLAAVVLLVLTLAAGPEIKGAQRWLPIGGVSLQASEFAKPAFAVVIAWLISARRLGADIPGFAMAAALFGILAVLLLSQPDVGQAVVVAAIWFTECFLAGLSMTWVALLGCLGLAGIVGAYLAFPHVAGRIDRFLDPSSGDSYQVDRAMEAFLNGGLFGKGPGQGTVKETLPDAHADFIFAVAGEEFGLIACLAVVGIFAFVVLRGFQRVLQETNLFVVLAASGLLVQFALQAIINMASAVNLMPTKGMTLPFISYGGSSLVALAIGMGLLLALTRKRAGGSA